MTTFIIVNELIALFGHRWKNELIVTSMSIVKTQVVLSMDRVYHGCINLILIVAVPLRLTNILYGEWTRIPNAERECR